MATQEPAIPKKVLIKASEIPVAKAEVSGAPALAKAENERIIPNTVPINPNKVAIEAQVDKITKFFESIGNSKEVASSKSFWIAATFSSFFKLLSADTNLYLDKPALTTEAKEPFCLSHYPIAESTWPLDNSDFTFLTKVSVLPLPLAFINVKTLSIENTMIIKSTAIRIGTMAIPPL